ncbi:MAG: KEOPS complex subunit Pcc1 [Candidatus Micrarchaeaceae archaeon]
MGMKRQTGSSRRLVNSADAKIVVRKGLGISISRIIKSANLKSFERSYATISETKDAFTITIKAKDLTALRASINSIMRELKAVEETCLAVPKTTVK